MVKLSGLFRPKEHSLFYAMGRDFQQNTNLAYPLVLYMYSKSYIIFRLDSFVAALLKPESHLIVDSYVIVSRGVYVIGLKSGQKPTKEQN